MKERTFKTNFFLVFCLVAMTIFTKTADCSDQYTELLLQSNTFNGSTVFSDSSDNNHSIVVSGNPQHSTAYAKFGLSSMYFDGDDHLEIDNPQDFNFRTDQYTIDFWMLQTTTAVGKFFYRAEGNYADFRIQYDNEELRFLAENSTDSAYLMDIRTSGLSIKDGNWHHIAFVRSSTHTKIFVDGIVVASTTNSYDVNYTTPFIVGAFTGYLDEFRVSSGIARWETNFTPPDMSAVSCDYNFAIENIKGSVVKAVSVPFVITNNTSSGIEGVDITLDFDPAVFEAKDVTLTGGILETNYLQNFGINTPGKIIISISAVSQPFVLSSGVAGFITFDVLSEVNSSLTISEIVINETTVCKINDEVLFEYDDPPSLPVDSPIITEDFLTGINTPVSITFTVNDPDTNSSDLVISAISSDQSIVPDDNIVFSMDGNLVTMTITPVQDQSVYALPIDINISDGASEIMAQINLTIGTYHFLAGDINYYTGVNNTISNVTLVLKGEQDYTVTSNIDGQYTFTGVEPGNYSLTLVKQDGLSGLDANDSTRIRRYKVEDISFDCNQMIAADVTLNGTIGALDASRVAIGSAKIDANLEACMQNDSCTHWKFISSITNPCNQWPPALSLNEIPVNLNSSIADMDVTGIRLGDVTGNWKNIKYMPPGSGNALNFDGNDDYVDLGDSIDLANKSFSIEFWAKRLSSDSDHFIIGQGTQSDNQFLNIGFNASNTFKFGFGNNALTTDTTQTDNQWHHWAITYSQDSKQRVLYRDGVELKNDVSSADYSGNGSMVLGKALANSNFHGQIDELRIWATTRTLTEIAENMNKKLTGVDQGLVACYNFDQYAGTTLPDITKFSKVDYGSNFVQDPESPSHRMESASFDDNTNTYSYANTSGYGLVNMNDFMSLTQGNTYRLSIKVKSISSGTPSIQSYIAFGGSHNTSILESHVSSSPAISGNTYVSTFECTETRSDYFLHYREWATATVDIIINLEGDRAPEEAHNGTLMNMNFPGNWVNSDADIDE
ncbi:secreted protein containing Laminin G, subdomain 2 [Candidatus Magnetomorum sp. HK-1]|nr:secreted protein containing Laminin G, subdomain 2 [Candidatus Magnetomorum sp. HK-1]